MARRDPRIVVDKALGKLGHVRRPNDEAKAMAWAAARAVDFEARATEADPELWKEATAFAATLEREAAHVLADAPPRLSGGADIALVYFLTRWRRPQVVVETGVAAGWSSRAILEALERNGRGRLWSSDVPKTGLPDADRWTGVLVPAHLQDRWTLLLEGDRRNLPRILGQCGPVDLFHYDSDKTESGRQRAVDAVAPRLSSHAITVIDDVGDNLWFQQWSSPGPAPLVARSDNSAGGAASTKYVGIVGWDEAVRPG